MDNNSTHDKLPRKWILLLGSMIAIGPLSIDIYLPALPRMAETFSVSTEFLTNTVPAYFLGLVFGQLFYGPLSDRIGRRTPIFFGMTLFAFATMLCIYTDNVYVLFVARTLQALGACVTSVVAKAAIRDRFPPKQMARAIAMVILVMGVAPIFAPSLGSLLLYFFDWHIIFYLLLFYSILLMVACFFFFQETLSVEKRNTTPLRQSFVQYKELLKDMRFVFPALSAGLLIGGMFTYISIAAVLFMQDFGLSEQLFSIVFGANACGFILLTQVNGLFIDRFRMITLVRFGVLLQIISAVSLMTLGFIWGLDTWLPFVCLCLLVGISSLGITQPNIGAIALAYQKHRAGIASAMQGAINFIVGIFGGLMLNVLPFNSVAKLGIMMSLFTIVAAVFVWKIDPNLDLSKLD